MNKQSDIDEFFKPISLKKQKRLDFVDDKEQPSVPSAPITTESLYQSLALQDDETLSPRSLKSKQILVDLKEQEKQVGDSIKQITEMQRQLSAKCDQNHLSDLNINSRMKGQLKEKQILEQRAEEVNLEENQELRQMIRFESNQVPAFGQIVQSMLKKRFHGQRPLGQTCDKCLKIFTHQWQLKAHIPKCQQPDRTFSRLQVLGHYVCLICGHDSVSKEDLKKHFFYNHGEVDMLVKYGQQLERVLGPKMHSRLRIPMLNRIGAGKFDRAIQIIVEKIDDFDINTLDHLSPLEADEDPVNKSRRKLVYTQKREMIHKIATLSKEASLTILTESEDDERRKTENQLTWDLSKNLAREWLPDEVIRCLRFTIFSLKNKCKHLPTFKEIYKDGSMVMLKFSHLAISLRDVIGKRDQMYQHGSKIIKLLLTALLELQTHGLKVFNIEPSSVYINEDYSQLIFTDIKNMTSKELKLPPTVTTYPPYCGLFGLLKERETWETHARDMYSIGVIILEVLVGTEQVIMSKETTGISKLLHDLEDYLDPKTMALLNYLIRDHEEVDLQKYIASTLDDDKDQIKENVLRVREAIATDSSLKKADQCFWIFMQYNSARCLKEFKILKVAIDKKICRDEEENKLKK